MDPLDDGQLGKGGAEVLRQVEPETAPKMQTQTN